MKIGIVSDTHFGYRRFEQDALSQGTEALLSAAEKCDLLLMPGDIFDAHIPRLETISDVAQVLKRLSVRKWGAHVPGRETASPIAAIHGTHERRGRGLANPIQLFDTLDLWIDVHNKTVLFEKNGEKVAISGVGGVPEDLAAEAMKQAKCAIVPGAFNIFALHQSLKEFLFDPHEQFMSLEDLPPGYDLYVCGHIHKHTVAMGGKFIIPGSTVITQLKEDEGQKKGFVIYDTEKKAHEFVQINSRPFLFRELKFENATPHAIEEAVQKELQSHEKDEPKPILRLKLSGSLAQGLQKSDISAPSAGEFVFIDNFLESGSLKQKMEQIRALRKSDLSVRDMGMALLKEKLKDAGLDPKEADEMFDALCDQPEKAVEISRRKRSSS
jgi:DNA repair exonuclease SbcCD nuclease subunit